MKKIFLLMVLVYYNISIAYCQNINDYGFTYSKFVNQTKNFIVQNLSNCEIASNSDKFLGIRLTDNGILRLYFNDIGLCEKYEYICIIIKPNSDICNTNLLSGEIQKLTKNQWKKDEEKIVIEEGISTTKYYFVKGTERILITFSVDSVYWLSYEKVK